MQDDNEPQGIGFFSIKTKDTHYARLEPTIQAYINSSDMGINASRGQDFGWRLAAEWVHMVRDFRRDDAKMANLGAKLRLEEDESPSLTQILFSIYGAQIRSARLKAQEEENPYEEEYLEAISDKKKPKSQTSEELANFDKIAAQDEPTPAPENPGAPAEKPEKAAKKK